MKAGVIGLTLCGAGLIWFVGSREAARAPQAVAPVAAPVGRPSLYCDFYDFMHASVVVSFDFALALAPDRPPRFSELFESHRDGTKTTFDDDDRPSWTYALDDGTAAITSPDGATRILLYGLKPQASGVFWTEAGLRSDQYRNLEGKCRQANLAENAAAFMPALKGDQTP